MYMSVRVSVCRLRAVVKEIKKKVDRARAADASSFAVRRGVRRMRARRSV